MDPTHPWYPAYLPTVSVWKLFSWHCPFKTRIRITYVQCDVRGVMNLGLGPKQAEYVCQKTNDAINELKSKRVQLFKTLNSNILKKSTQNPKLVYPVYQIPRQVQILKNRGRKSLDTLLLIIGLLVIHAMFLNSSTFQAFDIKKSTLHKHCGRTKQPKVNKKIF